MRYSKWIGIAACLVLIAACFTPWTYHADVDKIFTGFFSEKNTYGKPGKFIIIFSIVSIALLILEKLWAKRVHIFLSAIMVSYAIKTYILYTSCYNAYCPEKRYGIFLMISCTLIIMAVSIFPEMSIKRKETV